MNCEKNTLRFFLGANTPQGFVSRFDQLADPEDGWREYVIKGGPGCGKSTMLEKIARACEDSSPQMELIHCSSDADSLDAVILPERKVSIVDGTPPHGKVYYIIKNTTAIRFRQWMISTLHPLRKSRGMSTLAFLVF